MDFYGDLQTYATNKSGVALILYPECHLDWMQRAIRKDYKT